MNSLFGAKAYYAFGFLALTSVVVAFTTATTTVLMCYFHLCAEDYRYLPRYRCSLVETDEVTGGIGERSWREGGVPSGSLRTGSSTGLPRFAIPLLPPPNAD